MGILGLKHLLYFATSYTPICREIMEAQHGNDETYYPVAVAGINLSKMLYDLFKPVGIGKATEKELDILSGHPRALEEVRT